MTAPLTQTARGEDLQWALTEFWTEHPDEATMLAAFEPELHDHTIFMTEHGVSHRKDFPLQVGATIVGLTIDGPVLFEGYNYSPFKGSDKDCAEIRGLRMADMRMEYQRDNGLLVPLTETGVMWRALTVIVAASSKAGTNKEINNLDWSTLDLCATPCRPKFMAHAAISLDTPITTLAVDLHNHAIQSTNTESLGAMDAKYAGIPVPLTSKQLLAE